MLKSSHIFSFPFVIDDNQFDFKNLQKYYTDQNNLSYSSDWSIDYIDISNYKYYNQYVYFHKNTRKLLYTLKPTESSSLTNDNSISLNLKWNLCKDKYIYKIKKINYNNLFTEYTLDLDKIEIQILNTNVGILSFNVSNYEYTNIKDIININEYGRRIFPQFISEDNNLKTVKETFLADSIEISLKSSSKKDSKKYFEDFTEFKGIESPMYLSSIIRDLINSSLTICNPNEKKSEYEKYNIIPIIDDRMFVTCHYLDDNFSKELSKNIYSNKWYNFIFIDKIYDSCDPAISNFKKNLIDKSTDIRWQDDGTVYGTSRYSFVAVTSNNKFCRETLNTNIINIYHKIMIIALLQRATILHYKNNIQDILDDKKYNNIPELQRSYNIFINAMTFDEVTAQEEGIDRYNKAKEIMDIDKSLNNLSNQIKDIGNLYSSEESKNLSIIAAGFLVPTLLISLFNSSWFINVHNIVLPTILISFPTFITYKILKSIKISNRISKIFIFIAIYIILILILFY